MSDTYQAIYDAVRSRISGGNVSEVVREAIREAFQVSHAVEMVRNDFQTVAYEQQRPFVLLRPKMCSDGNQWCALYGDNLQEGVAGFGDTPEQASYDFDKHWREERRPTWEKKS